MRIRAQILLYVAALLLSPILLAQTSAPPQATPSPATPSPAVDSPEITKLRADLDWMRKTLADWPNLGGYRDANTTPQMLIRFRPDVIALQPKAVVILAGTNDLSGNTGPMTLEATEGNLSSMAELARANGIRVVLASVMPVCDYIKPQTERRPPEKIVALNAWIKEYASKNGFVYLDYYSAMIDDSKMFKRELTYDGLHPNAAGYDVMAPLAEKAIATALRKDK